MNQVLIYTKREEFRSYLDSECLNIRECFPVFYDNMGDLETILELFPKLDVLIVDASQGPEEFEQLYHFVKDRKDKITHILLVSDKESDAYTRVFNSTDWVSLLQHLKVILGENETPKEGFVGIPLDCLIHFKVMPFALFLNVSPGKFIKRIPAFEAIDVDVIE